GLRGGKARVCTLAASITWRNDEQYLRSRSCSRYLGLIRKAVSSIVTLRPICSIHCWSGWGVIPARQTTRAKSLAGHFLWSGLRSKCRHNPAFFAYFTNEIAEFLCS